MISISTLLSQINYIEFTGKKTDIIEHICKSDTDSIQKNGIIWLNDKNLNLLGEFEFVTIICSRKASKEFFKSNCNYILVENPRKTFQNVLTILYPELPIVSEISKTAIIDNSSIVLKPTIIGNFTVVGKNCKIGRNVKIGNNNTILDNCVIGDNVIIGNNNTIGGVGFGYEKDEEGKYVQLKHIGGVIIEDFVEIGNNTCIDRAVLGNTILKKNCKVDNLVHIAHGVEIGENSLIIANSMIAGSATIGKNCWIAPSSSIINKAKIGDNSLIGLGAVVTKNVNSNSIFVGNPAKFLRENL
jgi:UDP-3-O-[3-hydroxymyristoyl] glucosamine N-acyltransferase